MQTLESFNHHSRKLPAYYQYYDRHFESRRMDTKKLLEIGIQYGGSLEMWAKYFPKAEITGADIDPLCKIHQKGKITVKIGDQTDEKFLSQFTNFDIIIDDGGHTMKQQQVSFKTLFPLLNPGGIYVIEDLHTSYWPEFFDATETMMDSLSKMTHAVNIEASKHVRAKDLKQKVPALEIEEMHFYQSLCFIYKQKGERKLEPNATQKGGMRFKMHAFIHKLRSTFR